MKLILLIAVLGMGSVTLARQPGPPQLSDTERECVRGIVGEGERPSREKMHQAMEQCGVQRRGPNFTDDQRTCLESHLGKPGEGTHPTRSQMEAAHLACGIELPPRRHQGANQNEIESIKSAYVETTDNEEKLFLRGRLREIFFTSNDETLKSNIREFLLANPEVSGETEIQNASLAAGQ